MLLFISADLVTPSGNCFRVPASEDEVRSSRTITDRAVGRIPGDGSAVLRGELFFPKTEDAL